MRCQNDGGSLLCADSTNLSLKVTTTIGVNACRGLIEQDNVRVAHDGNTETDLALVTSAQVADLLVLVGLKSEVGDDVFDEGSAFLALNASNGSEVPEGLLYGHLANEFGVLWAVADHAFDDIEVLSNFEASNENLAVAGLHFVGKALESGCLASAIDTKQSESLALSNTERKVRNSGACLQAEAFTAGSLSAAHGVILTHALNLKDITGTRFYAAFFSEYVNFDLGFLSCLTATWVSALGGSGSKRVFLHAAQNSGPEEEVTK